MDKRAKTSLWALRILIVLALIYDFKISHSSGISGGTAVLILSFLIEWINFKKTIINNKLIVIYSLFCIFALVLGTMLKFYSLISWWDLLMHVFSGIILGFTANELLNSLQKGHINPLLRFIFIIGFACLGGVMWEIYEFFIDMLTGIDSQVVALTGVNDTMEDLIADFLGGVIFGVINLRQR